MLLAETAFEVYSKAEHRRALLGQLDPSRSPQSVEFKHSNISVAMTEVKAAALGAQTPFYISSAELEFARCHPGSFALFRACDALSSPRLYVPEGDVAALVDLVPTAYRAQIRDGVGQPDTDQYLSGEYPAMPISESHSRMILLHAQFASKKNVGIPFPR